MKGVSYQEVQKCTIILFPYLTGFLAGKIFMSMVVARFSNDVAFSSVYIYSSELFPTTLRLVNKSCLLHLLTITGHNIFIAFTYSGLYSFLRDILILDAFFEEKITRVLRTLLLQLRGKINRHYKLCIPTISLLESNRETRYL